MLFLVEKNLFIANEQDHFIEAILACETKEEENALWEKYR